MKKKNKDSNEIVGIDREPVIWKGEDFVIDNFMPYAMSTILSRAIVAIDGLKPVHRRLLNAMYGLGLLSKESNRVKCAKAVSETMARYHPHGDSAVYETLVRMTDENESLLHPLIDGKGGFGKVYNLDEASAYRYTECKLAPIAEEFFKDIKKNVVPFVPNYDESTLEPVFLPVTFPSILANPNLGIAVGQTSNICSFNLRELCEATIAFISNPNIDLVKYLQAPDFSTGGQLLYNENDIRKIYNTGRGGFKLRAKYKYIKEHNCIEVYEIPYTTTVNAIIDKVIELSKEKDSKVKDIVDIRDEGGFSEESESTELKLTIDLKKNADPDFVMDVLYKLTSLEDTFSCMFRVLKPDLTDTKLMGIKEILTNWIDFRMQCISKQLVFDIDEMKKQLHKLYALEKILLDIDHAIAIIRQTKKESKVVPALMEAFSIDEVQAEYVAEIKLRNINEEYILRRTADIKKLEGDIAHNQEVLASEKKMKNIIVKQLQDVAKKYGQDRKTEIVHVDNIKKLTKEDMIEQYNCKITLSEHGYIKKIPLTSLRNASEHKLKDEDRIIEEIDSMNKNDLLLFSNKHVVYKLKVHALPETKTSMLGEYANNLLGLADDEKIIKIVSTEDYKGYMLFAFKDGKIAKITLDSYVTKTNRSKLKNAYSDDSELVNIFFIQEDMDLVCVSSINKIVVFNTSEINSKASTKSSGVAVLKLKKESKTKKMSFMASCVELSKFEKYANEDMEYYRKNIPAVGYYRVGEEAEDGEGEQLNLFDIAVSKEE